VRVRLDIEYDGTKFCGWQKQENSVVTVQGTIEDAILKALGNSGQGRVILHGAGRTDAGVHAINQVAHFEIGNGFLSKSSESEFCKGDTERRSGVHLEEQHTCGETHGHLSKGLNKSKTDCVEFERKSNASSWNEGNISRFYRALNFYLINSGIVIKSSSLVDQDFHARFSAQYREYLYIICNRQTESALWKNRAWHVRGALDVSIMREAAQTFIGRHDFNAFRSADCQAQNSIRTIDSIGAARHDDLIVLTVLAKSFLHNQVRIMTGTLVQIGLSKMPIETVKKLLTSGNRTDGGPTAPPYGLYLKNVGYEKPG
jgi:tRNA pseudouridine(38-40) synthase